jgi:hypothetical protein
MKKQQPQDLYCCCGDLGTGWDMPCLIHWHSWLCHAEVGRTLVSRPSGYRSQGVGCAAACKGAPYLIQHAAGQWLGHKAVHDKLREILTEERASGSSSRSSSSSGTQKLLKQQQGEQQSEEAAWKGQRRLNCTLQVTGKLKEGGGGGEVDGVKN